MATNRGSFTVEAALVIPVMIFSIFAVIYLSIVHYQNIITIGEATRAANRVASYWSYIGGDTPSSLQDKVNAAELITEADYEGRSPYRFIAETTSTWAGGIGKRKANAETFTGAKIRAIPFHKYEAVAGNSAVMGTEVSLLSSYVTVTVGKQYVNPLGKLLVMLGVKESQDYQSTARSLITSPTEFIRNIDMIFEVGDFLLSLL